MSTSTPKNPTKSSPRAPWPRPRRSQIRPRPSTLPACHQTSTESPRALGKRSHATPAKAAAVVHRRRIARRPPGEILDSPAPRRTIAAITPPCVHDRGCIQQVTRGAGISTRATLRSWDHSVRLTGHTATCSGRMLIQCSRGWTRRAHTDWVTRQRRLRGRADHNQLSVLGDGRTDDRGPTRARSSPKSLRRRNELVDPALYAGTAFNQEGRKADGAIHEHGEKRTTRFPILSIFAVLRGD